MKYPIWSRFSAEARRAAATATYDGRDNEDHRRTFDGCCPLGVALNHDRVRHPEGMTRWVAPMPALLSRATTPQGPLTGCEAFVDAWDAGRIDLDTRQDVWTPEGRPGVVVADPTTRTRVAPILPRRRPPGGGYEDARDTPGAGGER